MGCYRSILKTQGDRCIDYFHKLVLIRNKANNIIKMKVEGKEVLDRGGLQSILCSFFEHLYTDDF